MRTLITILGFLNGSYMLLDGLYVIFIKKYIGPVKPGPWANLFYMLKVDVYKLGPLFIVYGLLWLTWLFALWTNHSWTYFFGIAVSILTLWYLPIGTVFSIIVLIIILIAKTKLRL